MLSPRTDSPVTGLPRARRCDVAVVGAGPAGVVAALAAAREGLDVFLVERLPFLGGSATAALVGPWMAFRAGARAVVAGIAEEIVGRLATRGGCLGHLPDPLGVCESITPFDSELLKLLLIEMVQEAGVKLALHSVAFDLQSGPDGLDSIILLDRSGPLTLRAKVFIDASGDAVLAAGAGVPIESGRPGDGLTQPLTALYKVGGVDEGALRHYVHDHPEEFVLGCSPEEYLHLPCLAVSGFFSHVRAAKASGALTIARDRVLLFGSTRPGEVLVNMTRIQGKRGHVAEELTDAEVEGTRQIAESFEFLSHSIPGFGSSFLLQTPTQIGIRETRRIVGSYVLTEADVRSGARFKDSIALGGFPIDIHAPTGSGVDCPQSLGVPYEIPFRCLVPPRIPNLLVAGRCLSATFEAHASARITPTCMALGQAAGIAAALMATRNTPNTTVPVREMQSRLTASNALWRL